MIYEISKHQEKFSFEAPNLKIAALVVCSLCHGQYPAISIDGELFVPQFIFGGHDEWFISNFGTNFVETLNEVLSNEKEQFYKSLNTVLMGEAESRKVYQESKAFTSHTPKAVLEHSKDKLNSKYNNFCQYAWAFAEQVSLYKTAQEGEA
ncbi:Uncharacterised protein [Acinetobacter baumannii]|uniref:hypothetical protein n=1 Tax=Acinetobacter baumannii TaxID=470 RepID=UPI000DE7527C|nr:hypothetical protein [Acinetobacter baumannii]SSM54509.1 Uncharacterised protein [Acinetobacter baumannii]SSM54521.1 Uncharacterised protein [Acinetobacter baumannii]SSM91464.1 Uncharacterised protein [Acinetobacter baumannii]SSN35551.1 Uncharacterised protein [Acinetobacter baumannii]